MSGQTIDLRLSSDVGNAAGNRAYLKAMCVEGDAQGNSGLVLVPVAQIGRIPRLYVNAPGRSLALTDVNAGIITSTSDSQTALLLPNMTADKTVSTVLYPKLNYTRDPANPLEISFLFQRGGNGLLLVNPVDSSVVINWNGLDPQYLPAFHPPVMLTSAGSSGGVDTWFAH